MLSNYVDGEQCVTASLHHHQIKITDRWVCGPMNLWNFSAGCMVFKSNDVDLSVN